MPNVLPTIPNDPPQGIQALLDKVYLWNPDAANNLIIRINELLKEIEESGVAVTSVNGQTGEVELTAEDIKAMFAGEEESIQVAIDTLKTDQGELGDQVSSIEEKIPESASSTNQLVTKNEVSSGYLPLAGGTLEPAAAIGFVRYAGATVHTLSVSSVNALATSGGFQCGRLYPKEPKNTNIGDSVYSWKTIYVAAMNNGADIAIPTEGGTLALVEDIAESVTTKDLTVGTDEGTLNIGITAGTATIATNNGLDIVAQTKFDTAPTTDDATAWADVNATALVTKAQVTTALSTAGGGTSVTIRNWA